MKTNFTHILIIRIILFILICLYSILVFGQEAVSANQSSLLVKNNKAVLADELSATITGEKVKLHWSLVANNSVNTIIIEKGYSSDAFKDCAIFWVNVDGNNQSAFKYSDAWDDKRSVSYRLKIVDSNGQVSYSNVLNIAGKKQNKQSFQLYPSRVSSFVAVKIKSGANQDGIFEIVNYAGQVLLSRPVQLQQGENNFRIEDLEKLPKGNYITVVRTSGQLYSQTMTKN